MTNPRPTAGPLLPNVPIPKVLAGQTALIIGTNPAIGRAVALAGVGLA